MSEHFFGLGSGHLSARADKIARKHGAYLINHTEPRGEERHWFACRNRGEPFDRETAEAVIADLATAGIDPFDPKPWAEVHAFIEDHAGTRLCDVCNQLRSAPAHRERR